MSRVEENWDRLVQFVLRRETTGGIAGNVLENNRNIDAILTAADEIQDEDPNVSRILCEHAYSLAENLDPNSKGRGVLQFKTGVMSVIKQKLARKEGGSIDRSMDITRLREFYKLYRERHKVDELRDDEMKLRESGVFSGDLGELERKTVKRKRVFATLKILGEVLEELSKEISPEDAESLIPDDDGNNNKMSRVEENWDRLVRSVLRRELRRERTGSESLGRQQQASGIASNVPSSLENNRDIDAILRVADEIQDEDPNVSRILCEHAYSLAKNLDPNSEGRGVLQFKAGLMSVIQQKRAKRVKDEQDKESMDKKQAWDEENKKLLALVAEMEVKSRNGLEIRVSDLEKKFFWISCILGSVVSFVVCKMLNF